MIDLALVLMSLEVGESIGKTSRRDLTIVGPLGGIMI